MNITMDPKMKQELEPQLESKLEVKKKYKKCSKEIKLSHQEALRLQVTLECVLLALLSPKFNELIKSSIDANNSGASI